MLFYGNVPLIKNIFTLLFSIKFLFPTSVKWVSCSDYLESIYIGTNSGILCISKNDWQDRQALSHDTILVVGSDVNIKEIYSGEVEEFNLAIRGTLAIWTDEGKIVIFDLHREKIECTVQPAREEERYTEAYVDPFGKTALSLVEIDKEEESLLLYEWRLLDIHKNEWLVLDSVKTTLPKTFLSWLPNGEEILFHNEYDGTTSIVKKDGSLKSVLNLVPSPDMVIESVSFSPDGELLALCFKDEEDQGGIFIYSRNSNDLKKLADFKQLKMNPNNITWSPQGDWILFRDTYPSDPLMRLISSNGEHIFGLFPVPLDYLEEPVGKWLSAGKHIVWHSKNIVNITKIAEIPSVSQD